MIDVKFDFTSDSPGYWDGFWENNDGLGGGGSDPDSASAVLQRYNQELWSKELPNGEKMELALGENGSLSWNGFRFGSDSIITSFRYKRQRALLEQVAESMNDYRGFVEDFLHKTYTIGGEIIFPKHARSINQARGVNPLICDRFDLTLECIRRYYAGVSSPLYEVLCGDGRFFDLFGDFRGYVEFFLLQDLVSEDYSAVKFWDGWIGFSDNPIPQTVEGYLEFLEREVEFVGKRGEGISFKAKENDYR